MPDRRYDIIETGVVSPEGTKELAKEPRGNYLIELCEDCGGSGDSWDWYCSECGGSGVVCGGCGRRLAECECPGDDDDG